MAGLGATHYRWRPDVKAHVDRVLARHPGVTANTYVNHPWAGWDDRSVDFWGPGGRGDAISRAVGQAIAAELMAATSGPVVRHLIYRRRWWLRGVGWRRWNSNDHSGELRHVHVTFL